MALNKNKKIIGAEFLWSHKKKKKKKDLNGGSRRTLA